MSNEMSTDFTPSTEATGAANESLGAWLTQVRTGYGAEQRDVAHHLGLNPTLIQAIETDDFARLGAPVFVRGYLSRYARLLNLPEQAVLERYRQQLGITSQAPHRCKWRARCGDRPGFAICAACSTCCWWPASAGSPYNIWATSIPAGLPRCGQVPARMTTNQRLPPPPRKPSFHFNPRPR